MVRCQKSLSTRVGPYRRSSRVPRPDAIAGGTWEALERVLRSAGYFNQGLPKKEVADAVGRHMNPGANTSPSFATFRAAVLEATPACDKTR